MLFFQHTDEVYFGVELFHHLQPLHKGKGVKTFLGHKLHKQGKAPNINENRKVVFGGELPIRVKENLDLPVISWDFDREEALFALGSLHTGERRIIQPTLITHAIDENKKFDIAL